MIEEIKQHRDEVAKLLSVKDNDFLTGSLLAYNAMMSKHITELEEFIVGKIDSLVNVEDNMIARGYLMACEKILFIAERKDYIWN